MASLERRVAIDAARAAGELLREHFRKPQRVAYKGGTGPFEFHPGEVEAWLAQRFPE